MSDAIVAQDGQDARTVNDVVSDFLLGVMAAAQHARQELAQVGEVRRGSRVMAMAVASGLEPRGWYSVAEVSHMTGVARNTVYDEAKRGRLRTVMPAGATRGYRASVADIEEWLDGMEARKG